MAILLVYFENKHGNVCLPPTNDCPTLPGYERRECHYLHEVDKIQKRLYAQTVDELEREGIREQAVWGQRMAQVRSDLITRMHSAATIQYEKDFIAAYLCLSDERKREQYRSRFTCDMAYFAAREFDNPEEATVRALDIVDRQGQKRHG